MPKSTNISTQAKQRNYSIDLLKFICAILVVFLHSHWKYEDVFLPFTRCAVPCFFMISGFLLYNNGEVGAKRIKRNFKNVLQITFYATLLFFIWTEFISLASSHSLFISSWKQMLNWIVFNECPFGHHLWYLFAYLYVLLIVGLLEKKNKLNILLYITPLLLVIDVMFGKYSLLLFGLNYLVVFLRNFLFVGIPYFCLGIIIKKFFDRLFINKIILLGGLILFTLTSYMERDVLISLDAVASRDHYLSSTFLAVCLFLLGTSFSIKEENTLSRIGKNDTLYIYILHPMVLMLIQLAKNRFHNAGFITYSVPLICFLITLVLIYLLKACKMIK